MIARAIAENVSRFRPAEIGDQSNAIRLLSQLNDPIN